MKKILKIFIYILILSLFIPITSFALSSSYKDVVSDDLDVEVEKDKINIYLFYGSGCPHCKAEKELLSKLEDKYPDKLNIYLYEVWDSKDNTKIMRKLKKDFGLDENDSVPFTVIGEKYFYGYSDNIGVKIEKQIITYLDLEEISDEETVVEESKINIPFLGEVNTGEVTIGVVAIILGFVDGFNPCAMWILLFLINMLFGMKDKKKMFILGFSFLFTSALFYFLSMLGINIVLDFISTNELRSLIGLVAIGFGIYNLYIYFRDRKKENGCSVVDEAKRKNIIDKMKKIKNSKNFFLALCGIVLLAISVNMVELACSAGFPTIFSEILVQNNVTGILRIIYLLIYVVFYMIDDMVVFTISVCTLSIAGVTTKYNKLVKIIGGLLMLIMGLLLIFKPEWIMLNF
mgnify:CR=1 FL=1